MKRLLATIALVAMSAPATPAQSKGMTTLEKMKSEFTPWQADMKKTFPKVAFSVDWPTMWNKDKAWFDMSRPTPMGRLILPALKEGLEDVGDKPCLSKLKSIKIVGTKGDESDLTNDNGAVTYTVYEGGMQSARGVKNFIEKTFCAE
jgi:hypothetical protein